MKNAYKFFAYLKPKTKGELLEDKTTIIIATSWIEAIKEYTKRWNKDYEVDIHKFENVGFVQGEKDEKN